MPATCELPIRHIQPAILYIGATEAVPAKYDGKANDELQSPRYSETNARIGWELSKVIIYFAFNILAVSPLFLGICATGPEVTPLFIRSCTKTYRG